MKMQHISPPLYLPFPGSHVRGKISENQKNFVRQKNGLLTSTASMSEVVKNTKNAAQENSPVTSIGSVRKVVKNKTAKNQVARASRPCIMDIKLRTIPYFQQEVMEITRAGKPVPLSFSDDSAFWQPRRPAPLS